MTSVFFNLRGQNRLGTKGYLDLKRKRRRSTILLMKYRHYYDPKTYKTGESPSQIEFKVRLEGLTDELKKQVIEGFIKNFCVGCLFNPKNIEQQSDEPSCSTPNQDGATTLSFPEQQNTVTVFKKGNCSHLLS